MSKSDSKYDKTCPLSQQQLIDEYFIEYRAHALAIASFLDRLDRARERNAAEEFRYKAFREAVAALTADEPGRAERVQMILSDPRLELLETRDRQGAFGAFDADNLTKERGDGR
jgi:hypothetical protein